MAGFPLYTTQPSGLTLPLPWAQIILENVACTMKVQIPITEFSHVSRKFSDRLLSAPDLAQLSVSLFTKKT